MAKFLRNISYRFRQNSTSPKSANDKKWNYFKNKQSDQKNQLSNTVNNKQKLDLRKDCQCKILLLDHTDISIVVSKKALGEAIYAQVFDFLDLEERDYFGLQYTDHYHVHHWLDPLKKIYKQVPIGPPFTFRFCVKFYSSEPNNLREEITRYQFFLQLRNDIQTGTLPCSIPIAIELSALALQSEFGDYNEREHNEVFVSEFRFHPLQDEVMECAILEYYKTRCRGLSPAVAELEFLNKVKWLEFYGVDMHIVEGRDANEYRLGLTPTGMLVFDKNQKIGFFFWEKIQRLDFRNQKLTLIVEEDIEKPNSNQIQLHTFVFDLSSHKACKHLWKCAIEYHTFFRLKFYNPSKRAIGHFFRLGSTFKYRGRTEYENVHQDLISTSKLCQKSIKFKRSSSQRYVPRQSHLQKQKFRQEASQQIVASVAFDGKEWNYGSKTILNKYNNEKKPINALNLKNNNTSSKIGCDSTVFTTSSSLNLDHSLPNHYKSSNTSTTYFNDLNNKKVNDYNNQQNTSEITTIKINNNIENNIKSNKNIYNSSVKFLAQNSFPSTSNTKETSVTFTSSKFVTPLNNDKVEITSNVDNGLNNKSDNMLFNNTDNNGIGNNKNKIFNLKAFTNKNNDISNRNKIFTNTTIKDIKFKTKNDNTFLNGSSVTEDLDQTQEIKTLINPQIMNIIPNAFSTSTLDERINNLQEKKNDIEQTKDLSFAKLIKNSNNFKRINNSTIIVCTEKSGIPRLLLSEYNQSKNKQICTQQQINDFLPLPSINVCKSSSEFQQKKFNKTSSNLVPSINSTDLPSKTQAHISHSKSLIIPNTISRNLLFTHNDNKIPSYARKKSLQSRYHQSCQN